MPDIYPFLEKLYALRDYAFRRRFSPLALAIFFAFVTLAPGLSDISPSPESKSVWLWLAPLLAVIFGANAIWVLPHESRWLRRAMKKIEDYDFEEAHRILASPPPLISFSARVKQLTALTHLQVESGDLPAAYENLLLAEQETLLPDEKNSLQLTRASLMFKAGNHSGFFKTLAQVDASIPALGALRFRYSLLKSHAHELTGEYLQAKASLEEVIETTQEPTYLVIAFNNLARLEDIQGNDTSAQSYYERAWQGLREHPMPKMYPVTGHNLLLKYSQNGVVDKALVLMTEYREMVSPSDTQQYLEFLNDQTHLARQLGDRHMLLDSYANAEQVFAQQADPCQRLAFVVSELRMRFNDGLPISNRLTEAASLLKKIKSLPTKHRLHVLHELMNVLRHCGTKIEGRDFQELEKQVIADFLAMERDIDAQLRGTPPALPIVRDMWYGHKLTICKLKIRASTPTVPRSDFDKLFGLLRERRQTWADKQNFAGEFDALFAICAEFVAYAEPLGPQFTLDYGPVAAQALMEARQALDQHWPHPSVHKHALALSYFYWKLAGDRQNSSMWLTRFEERKLNLAHYATWFREWHTGVRAWLASFNSSPDTAGVQR